MAHTAIKKKMLAALPVEERKRRLWIEKAERRLEKKKSSGKIIGILAAYDNLIGEWYRMLDKLDGDK